MRLAHLATAAVAATTLAVAAPAMALTNLGPYTPTAGSPSVGNTISTVLSGASADTVAYEVMSAGSGTIGFSASSAFVTGNGQVPFTVHSGTYDGPLVGSSNSGLGTGMGNSNDGTLYTYPSAAGEDYFLVIAPFSAMTGAQATFTPTFTYATTAIGAPEPAGWAMMMLGVGGIGFAMRRRAKLAAVAA
jgi:hypothetical protein